MPRFPGYRFPFQYYKPYNYAPYPPVITKPAPKETPPQIPPPPQTSIPSDYVWLDLFGIKLYFDDVLILSLLFLLYNEEIKDEGLFLSLIMLLIS